MKLNRYSQDCLFSGEHSITLPSPTILTLQRFSNPDLKHSKPFEQVIEAIILSICSMCSAGFVQPACSACCSCSCGSGFGAWRAARAFLGTHTPSKIAAKSFCSPDLCLFFNISHLLGPDRS